MKALEPLVGEWTMAAQFENLPTPDVDVDAWVTFEWMDGRRFLVERWAVPIPEAPDGLAVIGPDPDVEGGYLQHYFDTRGVARVYKMSSMAGSGHCRAMRRTSRRSTFASDSPARSARTAGGSKAPGRSTRARAGGRTSTSPTRGADDAISCRNLSPGPPIPARWRHVPRAIMGA